jgi:DNA modification methylase
MIPQVARTLLKDYAPEGSYKTVFDPYMGSGTTLVEASLLGKNSFGTDINPLAELISSVKTTHYDVNTIKKAFNAIQNEVFLFSPDKVKVTDFDFITSCDFWYSHENLLKLSYLTQVIDDIDSSISNFYRVALAEVIREVSFTRNGEFKRFKMPEERIQKFHPDTFRLFEEKVHRNILGLIAFNKATNSGIAITCHFNTSIHIPPEIIPDGSIDMVVTSPPYGDSRTTVAYGQFSRWANEWFKFDNAKNLDSFLMGGKKSDDQKFHTASIDNELKLIEKEDRKRYFEVISFLNDYYDSINNVAKKIRIGGRLCYVVGNRTVKGIQIPLDYFTAEMFEKNGFQHKITIVRSIPNKRMPAKTSPTNEPGKKVDTMSNEYIVIMTKNY